MEQKEVYSTEQKAYRDGLTDTVRAQLKEEAKVKRNRKILRRRKHASLKIAECEYLVDIVTSFALTRDLQHIKFYFLAEPNLLLNYLVMDI